MKPLYILLIALFFSISHCDDEGESKSCSILAETTGVEDCNSRKNEKDKTEYICCLAEYEAAGVELEGCLSLTKEAYDDIDKTIKEFKTTLELDELEIDCGSNFIILSLLSLILLLL